MLGTDQRATPETALDELLGIMGLARAETGGSISFSGADPVAPGRHRLGTAAAAALAAQGAAVAAIWKQRSGQGQDIEVDLRKAAVPGLRTIYHIRQSGYRFRVPPVVLKPVQDFYRTRDGRLIYILRAPAYAETLLRTLDLLDCAFNPAAMAKAVAAWDALELEDAIAERRLVGVVSRGRTEWAEHPQGAWLHAQPVIEIVKIGDSAPKPFAPAARPLAGVRVLDVTHVLAGPVATRTLAEQGADVLHISSPDQQDPARGAIDTGMGKRQAYLDLDRPDDAAHLKTLSQGADIFAESWRQGSLDRRGFSPEALAAARPGLIYLSLSCYGSDGPWRERAGYEPCGQVACGLAIDEGSEEAPKLASTSTLNDYLTAYLGAAGALAALLRRAEEGGSYHVRVSLTRSSMWVQELGRLPQAQWRTGELPEPAPEDFVTVDSPFGPISVARPATRLSATPPYWDRPSEPFGVSAPQWLPRTVDQQQ